MTGYKIPIFEKGMVLTHEMLETLKNYSVEFLEFEYDNYSDGIISGCEVTMQGDVIHLGKGIVMFQKHLYILPANWSVRVNPGTEWQVLRLVMGTISKEQNFLVGEVRLELSTDLQDCANKLEVCRFRLQQGSTLRNQYRNLNDLNTEYDTVNEICAQWSGYQNTSVSNRILMEFAKEMMKKKLQNSQDILMIQQILELKGKTMNRQTLQFYIATRTGREYTELDNAGIYKGLCEIAKLSQSGEGRPMGAARDLRRIIVD